VVPHHFFQLETGILLSKDKPVENVTVSTNNFATTLFRYGLVESIELRLSGAFLQEQIQQKATTETKSGLEGVNLGAKFHLAEESGLSPQMGLIASIIIPVGDKYFTDDEFAPGVIFAAAHTVTDWSSISYNLGGRYRKNQNSFARYSLALGIQPVKKIGLFAEIFGVIRNNNSPSHSVDFGMTYLPISNLQLDTTYGLAITSIAIDSFFNVGLSWRLPR
jgi:hypothetical protein